jgi:hypothetical protein
MGEAKHKANRYNLMVQEVEAAIAARLNDTGGDASDATQALQLFLKEGRVLDINTMDDGRRAAIFAFRGKQISIALSPSDGEPDPEAVAKASKGNGAGNETFAYVADDAMGILAPSYEEAKVMAQKVMLSVTRKPGEDVKLLRAVTEEHLQCVAVDWEENEIVFYISDNEDRAKKVYSDWHGRIPSLMKERRNTTSLRQF